MFKKMGRCEVVMTKKTKISCDLCESDITKKDGIWVVQCTFYEWAELHFCNAEHMMNYLKNRIKNENEPEIEKL
jgi:ribosomal protein L37AE/L43A